MENEGQRHRAGTAVARAGLYRVYHRAHRLPHLVLVLAGGLFPLCHYCGDKVEFVSLAHAELAAEDYDFAPKV